MKELFKIARALFKSLCAIIYYGFTYLVPKKNDLWVFGCWKGKMYSDNARALFEYVSDEHKEINAVWIAKNQEIYDVVVKSGRKVVLYPSFKAQYIIARAKINIQTESNEDTGHYRVGGTKVIQLFHGAAAIKEAFLYAGMSPIKKALVKIYADNHYTSYWMVASDYYAHRYTVLCETDEKKAFVTGMPRTDVLMNKIDVPYFRKFCDEHRDGKLIIYVPTHRNYGKNDSRGFTEKNWLILNEFLHNHNYYMFFKPHPNELKFYEGSFANYSNIILIDRNRCFPQDPCEYLHYFDLLISDYSSISSDYLVFDRPIIHYMYDIDSFAGADFNLGAIDKFVGGPICKTYQELQNAIKESLTEDKYAEKRSEVLHRVYKYTDNHNCQRVYQAILSLL